MACAFARVGEIDAVCEFGGGMGTAGPLHERASIGTRTLALPVSSLAAMALPEVLLCARYD
jgi:hypothetical protein